MTWTLASGIFTHTGVVRDFYHCDAEENELDVLYEIRAGCTAPAGNVKILVRASGDGRTGIECGIEGANLVIRIIEFGAVGTVLATTAHGIAAGTPFTLRVRQTNEGLACAAILTSGTPIEVDTDADEFRAYERWGLVSDVNNAVVSWIWNADLEPIFSDVEDVLTIVAAGDLWACFDKQTLTLVESRVMPLVGIVSMAVQDGQVWIVGGGKAKVFDPVARTVSNWTAADSPVHDLPGATTAGTTSATIVQGYRGGLALAVENLVYRSAVGDPLEWDTAELAEGRAWVIGGNINRSGLSIADHILCMAVLSENALFIGCVNSSLVLLGDPVDGAAELRPLSLATGISGPNAIALVDEGRTVFHSPEGCYALPTGGTPYSFSDVLNNTINFARSDRQNYKVTVIRDPARMGLHIFLSDGTGNDVHFWYDETANYQAGAGGFFPESYPFTPWSACIWRGEVIIGTRQGKLIKFSDTVKTDIDPNGTAIDIDSECSFTVMHKQPDDFEVLVDEIFPEMGADSDPFDVTLFGATTPELVYDSAQRYTLGTYTDVTTELNPLQPRQRSPVCLVQLSGPYMIVEALGVVTRGARRMSRSPVKPALVVGTSCSKIPTPPADEEPDDGPGRDTGVPSPAPGAGTPGSVVIE